MKTSKTDWHVLFQHQYFSWENFKSFKWHVYSLSFKTLTLRMIIILCSCGHPCLRVWVGGFTFVLVSPWTSFVPTQTLSHPKLVRGGLMEQSSWKTFPWTFTFENFKQGCCQNGQSIFECSSPPFGSLGSETELSTPDLAKQRRRKAGVRFQPTVRFAFTCFRFQCWSCGFHV